MTVNNADKKLKKMSIKGLKCMNALPVFAAALGLCLTAGITEETKEEYLKIGGSLRYRHETILQEDKDSQNRQRIQAKAHFQGAVNSQTSVLLELATGGATARSANVTLDEAFTKKAVMVNQALFTWNPAMVTGLGLMGGKMKNPFTSPSKTELIWDSDFVPEGLAAVYKNKYPSNLEAFAAAAGYWVDESSSADDLFLLGCQAGAAIPLGSDMKLTVGAGYHKYTDVKGRGPLDTEEGKFHGNSTQDTSGIAIAYAEDFGPIDAFLELGFKAGTIPMSVFGHYVQNLDASDDNMGYLGGVEVGKAKKPGTIALRAYYRVLEKDAVLDTYADSDFGGGGTGNSGLEADISMGIAQNVSGKATWFVNEKKLTNGTLYQRGQFDVKFVF